MCVRGNRIPLLTGARSGLLLLLFGAALVVAAVQEVVALVPCVLGSLEQLPGASGRMVAVAAVEEEVRLCPPLGLGGDEDEITVSSTGVALVVVVVVVGLCTRCIVEVKDDDTALSPRGAFVVEVCGPQVAVKVELVCVTTFVELCDEDDDDKEKENR